MLHHSLGSKLELEGGSPYVFVFRTLAWAFSLVFLIANLPSGLSAIHALGLVGALFESAFSKVLSISALGIATLLSEKWHGHILSHPNGTSCTQSFV